MDDGDYEKVAGRPWHLTEYGYAKSGGVFMHHLILPLRAGFMVDHKNGDGLDNRGSNLRHATKAENGFNRKVNANSRSGYKGVSWEAARGKWRVTIAWYGKRTYLGTVNTPEEGARLYNKAAQRFHGEFARLNVLP